MPLTDQNQNNDPQFGRPASPAPAGRILPKSANDVLRPEKVPLPPKRSRKARSQLVIFLNFLMTLVTLVAILAVGAVYYALGEYQAPGPLKTNTNFIVRNGAGVKEIAESLQRQGIITDTRVFRYVTANLLEDETLKAGEYEIKAGSSMHDIMELLKSGKSILFSVTLPEGLTVKQIFRRLADDPVLEGVLPAEFPPEGWLRPDTYKFSRGTKREEIVKQMANAQSRLVEDIWEKRDPGLTLASKEELVTLASIVEKETGQSDERTLVASVFLNRLAKGMRMQSDPTIVYGLFGGDGKPVDRPIFKSDIAKETPYNTYVIDGLPPTPIANPGRAALEAVANPSRTNFLYFVADGTGGHVFAETLEDHNANVKRWRKIQKDQGVAEDVEAQ